MPAVLPVYNPNEKAVRELALTEYRQRAASIAVLMRWRDGDHPDTLRSMPDERNDNISVNECGVVVEQLTEFIGVPELVVPGGVDRVADPTTGELVMTRSDPQRLLDELLADAQFELLSLEAHESGLTVGHIFIKILPDGMMGLIDPHLVTVFWDATRVMIDKYPLWYRLTWSIGDMTREQDIVRSELVEGAVKDRWVIIEREKDGRGEWKEITREVWDFPFSPICEVKMVRRPHHYYGMSVIEHHRLNDGLNFTLSNVARVIRHHAHPKTIALDVQLPDVTALDQFISARSSTQAQGQIFNLAIDANGIRHSMDFAAVLRQSFFSQARVVDPLTAKDQVGQLTNFGIRSLYSDQMRRVVSFRNVLERFWADVIQRVMVVRGITIERPMAVWPDPLPVSRAELVDTAGKEQALGITSGQSLADDLGRDYSKERQQLIEEGRFSRNQVFGMLEQAGQRGMLGMGGLGTTPLEPSRI